MVAFPAATPVTTPVDALIVAFPVLRLLQVPPATASLKVAVDPAQTVGGPVIAVGEPFTVTKTAEPLVSDPLVLQVPVPAQVITQ
jgi:hypothetical protein